MFPVLSCGQLILFEWEHYFAFILVTPNFAVLRHSRFKGMEWQMLAAFTKLVGLTCDMMCIFDVFL